ncbi:Prenyltransferase and squalene oxidase repeat protein [Gimesia panareensis]|uniref:Prenyltransferase and squalene oxidase repeat protein n=1 Tax=Gimesia panareensis TaxID=2527978 RepID=A0A517PZP7_9PLAN|nr:DUF4159 domain-containing protein [Gimesia panareensis]QDT24853.1 Prenyltransferase and squalene oxidase repeat protein [Gimesia panareensis]
MFDRLLTIRFVCLLLPACLVMGSLPTARALAAEPVTREMVLTSIEKAREYLLKQQQEDGTWQLKSRPEQTLVLTSFTLHALLHAGMKPDAPEIQRGLNWLRQQDPVKTHEISLLLETLSTAGEAGDLKLLKQFTEKLEAGHSKGTNDGAWSFGNTEENYAHFAALGLYEAAQRGVVVQPATWQRAREHWLKRQRPDGGWGSQNSQHSRGGITAAGIAYLVSTQHRLRAGQADLNAAGKPDCCGPPFRDAAVEAGCRWLGDHFTVTHNPSTDPLADGSVGYLYYLYCLERVGRLTGRRYFISSTGRRHDWYSEGAAYLVAHQNSITGAWKGAPVLLEDCEILATGYALHFLARGLTPILVGRLEWGTGTGVDQADIAVSSHDTPAAAWNLAQFTSRLQGWPKRLTWQSIDMNRAGAEDLGLAPVLVLDVADAGLLTEPQTRLLRDYLQQGGFLFAVGGCRSPSPDLAMQALVERLYPEGETRLRKLEGAHPVYRSEFPLSDPDSGTPLVELWGAETGCRTAIIYAPEDLTCLWEKWSPVALPGRTKKFAQYIERSLQAGVNVCALAAGRTLIRELPRDSSKRPQTDEARVEHRLLNIARIRHSGEWDAAPRALQKLLKAMNQVSAVQVATKPRLLSLTDERLFAHPLLYLHGRYGFALDQSEQQKLRTYLQQGGVLFADACCGASEFDQSFRRLVEQLFPGQPLKRIPVNHELFSRSTGYDLKEVRFRHPVDLQAKTTEERITRSAPEIEGIEIDGRLVVLYSKHDLSCAIEYGDRIACPGYVAEDAVRLGLNIVWYSLLH